MSLHSDSFFWHKGESLWRQAVLNSLFWKIAKCLIRETLDHRNHILFDVCALDILRLLRQKQCASGYTCMKWGLPSNLLPPPPWSRQPCMGKCLDPLIFFKIQTNWLPHEAEYFDRLLKKKWERFHCMENWCFLTLNRPLPFYKPKRGKVVAALRILIRLTDSDTLGLIIV